MPKGKKPRQRHWTKDGKARKLWWACLPRDHYLRTAYSNSGMDAGPCRSIDPDSPEGRKIVKDLT